MVKAISVVILVLLASVSSLAQAQVHQTLRLTTEISRVRFCQNDGVNTTSVNLKLRLTYTNIGRKPLILSNGSDLITYYKTAENELALKTAEYSHVSWMTSWPDKLPEIGAAPDERFVILSPGDSHEDESEIYNAIQPKPGEYLLQVIVPTWSESNERAHEAEKKWARIGILHTQDTKSEPSTFVIEGSQIAEDCSPYAELKRAALTDANARDALGMSALMAVIDEGDEKLFRDLLNRGADVNAKTDNGVTVLMVAAVRGESTIEELIRRKVDVNARNDEGESALAWAVQSGMVRVVKMLIDAGADVNSTDRSGKTPLSIAKRAHRSDEMREIIIALKKAGAR